jgi:hypothetical protein
MKSLRSCTGAFLIVSAVLIGSATPASLARLASPGNLPISKLVLYSSGVGYIQRDGQVDGDTTVQLRFKTEQINDILMSMIVQDFDGGHLSTITYSSRDPLTKTLKSFAVDLTSSPGLSGILKQLPGERVEVATPEPIEGSIVSVESKKERVDEHRIIEVEYLNILTASGLMSLPLTDLQQIRLLNEQLDAELRQALHVLAESHDMQKKSVNVLFKGDGKRRVRLAYLIEMPVWKMTYRLSLQDKDELYLQGWAIVENATDEDWNGVQISLASGQPISFLMDLYQPLYIKRPVLAPELHPSLYPQQYEQSVEAQPPPPRKRPTKQAANEQLRAFAVGRAAPASPLAEEAPTELTAAGVKASARAENLGALFTYTITTPIAIPRHTSAMLPIVSANLKGEQVVIYNEHVHPKFPLNGVRLQNNTSLFLSQGPMTVFAAGRYAGDARLGDLAAGQERLLSYAVDLKSEVVPSSIAHDNQLISVIIRKGTLIATHKAVREKVYTMHNRDEKQKTVLIEHPLQPGWELVAPPEPFERTRDVYRFRFISKAGETTQLVVREEKRLRQAVQLIDAGSDRISYFIQAREIEPAVQQALQRVITLRTKLEETRRHLARQQGRKHDIAEEQSRIRQNLSRLAKNSSLYNRYVGKLNQQETELETIDDEMSKLKQAEDAQLKALQDYLLNLDIGG